MAVELEQDAITSAAAKADNLRMSGQRIRADERYLSCVDNKLADVRLQGVHGDLGLRRLSRLTMLRRVS